jgi:hypothetical protein
MVVLLHRQQSNMLLSVEAVVVEAHTLLVIGLAVVVLVVLCELIRLLLLHQVSPLL